MGELRRVRHIGSNQRHFLLLSLTSKLILYYKIPKAGPPHPEYKQQGAQLCGQPGSGLLQCTAWPSWS